MLHMEVAFSAIQLDRLCTISHDCEGVYGSQLQFLPYCTDAPMYAVESQSQSLDGEMDPDVFTVWKRRSRIAAATYAVSNLSRQPHGWTIAPAPIPGQWIAESERPSGVRPSETLPLISLVNPV